MKRRICKRCLAGFLAVLLCAAGIQAEPKKAAAIGKPSVTVSKRTKTAATVKIKKLSGVTGYQVFLASSRSGKYQHIGSTISGTFRITKIKKNKVYYVKARAYKTSGTRITTGRFSSVAAVAKYSSESTSEKYAKKVLSLVNKERTKAGLAALKLNKSLNEAAEIRAKELAEEFSHIRPDGRDCFTALTDAGIIYSSVGENIAAGQASPQAVVAGWMASDGHRANIMSADYTQMGLGYYHSSKGNQHYWSQMFIKE